MADRARKLASKRLKRERKRRALRRAAAGSPVKRAAGGPLVECRITAGWREQGIASIYIARQGPAGLAVAGFLVDLWCAGLKDVLGYLDLTADEYRDMLDRAADRAGGETVPVPLDEAARLIAAGAAFARRNGFRLPADWDKWAAFAGPVDPAAAAATAADLSGFGRDGKLHWVGPREDLRRRLIGSTVEAFCARPDVTCAFGSAAGGGFAEDDEDGDDVAETPEERLEDLKAFVDSMRRNGQSLAEAARQWCLAEGRLASAELDAVAPVLMLNTFLAGAAEAAAADDGVDTDPAASPLADARKAVTAWIKGQPPARRAAMADALTQLVTFIQSAESPEAFTAVMDDAGRRAGRPAGRATPEALLAAAIPPLPAVVSPVP